MNGCTWAYVVPDPKDQRRNLRLQCLGDEHHLEFHTFRHGGKLYARVTGRTAFKQRRKTRRGYFAMETRP